MKVSGHFARRSIRLMAVRQRCISLSFKRLRERNKHGKTVTAHVESKVNYIISRRGRFTL